ncbi:Uncharacterised protein [uncultured Flavonifractor sp.]|nr:Uncharacterised protein [uncultured Flavonifractor sp.]
MGSLKRRLLPLLLSLVLLCSCTAGTPDSSLSVSPTPSEPAPSQVQSSISPSPSPSETALSEIQPSVSPTPATVVSEPSPSQSAPVPSQTAPVPLPSPSAAPVSEAPVTDTASEEPVEVTVYLTKTGEKYHSDGCQYLSRSQIPISLADAKAGGYTPCSKCNPPR